MCVCVHSRCGGGGPDSECHLPISHKHWGAGLSSVYRVGSVRWRGSIACTNCRSNFTEYLIWTAFKWLGRILRSVCVCACACMCVSLYLCVYVHVCMSLRLCLNVYIIERELSCTNYRKNFILAYTKEPGLLPCGIRHVARDKRWMCCMWQAWELVADPRISVGKKMSAPKNKTVYSN